MKLAKVPLHFVQQGLTRQPICKGLAPEWTFIRMTGNTGHYLSITSKVSTLKKNVLLPFQQLKGHEESQTNKYVTDIGTAAAAWCHCCGWGAASAVMEKRLKIWQCHKLEHYNLVFPLQRSTGCWAACGPSHEQLLSFALDYRALDERDYFHIW